MVRTGHVQGTYRARIGPCWYRPCHVQPPQGIPPKGEGNPIPWEGSCPSPPSPPLPGGGHGLGLLLYIHRYPCQTFACKGRYCVCSAYVIHVITRVMGRGVLTLLMVLILGTNLLFWSWKGCNGAAHRQLASYAPSLDVYGSPLTRVRHVIHVQGMYCWDISSYSPLVTCIT